MHQHFPKFGHIPSLGIACDISQKAAYHDISCAEQKRFTTGNAQISL